MSFQLAGSTVANIAEVDSNKNVLTNQVTALPAHPALGGYYSVTGGCGNTGVVAAALAANTMLMSMRFAVGSIRKAYVSKARICVGVATVGVTAGVAGTLGLVRFTGQTPTGGTARTPCELNEPLATATDMTDIRDSNAALTGTAPTFGTVVSSSLVPLMISSDMWMEWFIEPWYPIVLQPGDGLALRTIVQMAATQTWVYSYEIYWNEV